MAAISGPVPRQGSYAAVVLTKLSVAAAVLVLAGCGTSRTAGPDAPPPTPDGPTREQVLMADGLCAAVTSLDTEKAEAQAAAEPSPGGYTGPSADFYLTFVDSDVDMLVSALDELPESGVEAADRYVASFRAELQRIAPEITELVGDTWELTRMSEPQRVAIVAQVLELFESVDPEGPDLLTLVRENRDFREFYDLAPRCAPLEPPATTSAPDESDVPENVLPEDAADGTDLAACADGDCEVAITDRATVAVGDFTIDVTVVGEEVTTTQEFPGGGSGATVLSLGGSSSFGVASGATVTMTLNGLHDDTAVLEFSTE